jgi:Xaa-Pro aminopeptidase
LRQAGNANEQAMEAAVQATHIGATMEEIETAFMIEMARQGGQGVYILSGPGGLRAGRVHEGEPLMLDALGRYKHYHGDLGRSVYMGEGNAEVRTRNKAMKAGWHTALEMVRPGASVSEITSTVLKTVQTSGFPDFRLVVLHSLGLEHTDHPLPLGTDVPGSKGDIKLEENMVINIDMPFHELGWGGMHIEDTLLVTRNGFEPITAMKSDLVEING